MPGALYAHCVFASVVVVLMIPATVLARKDSVLGCTVKDFTSVLQREQLDHVPDSSWISSF
jgi:hypothetical protein